MVTVQVTTLSLIEGSRSSLEKSELASKSSSTNFICLFFLRFFGILPSESKDTVRGLPLGLGVLSCRGNLSGREVTEVFFIWSAVLFNVDIVKSNPWVCGGGSSWSPCSSGTDETSSLRKSNRLSDLIHIFK